MNTIVIEHFNTILFHSPDVLTSCISLETYPTFVCENLTLLTGGKHSRMSMNVQGRLMQARFIEIHHAAHCFLLTCSPPIHCFIQENIWKSEGAKVRAVWWVIKHFPSKALREPRCYTFPCHEEGPCLMTTLEDYFTMDWWIDWQAAVKFSELSESTSGCILWRGDREFGTTLRKMSTSERRICREVTVNCPSQETEVTSTPTIPVDNVVIATKGLQDRNINILAGMTVENKGKLIVTGRCS